MIAKKNYYNEYTRFCSKFCRPLGSRWMGSGDTECALYEYCNSAASGSSLLNMNSPAKTPNRHDFETEIWRLNNSISKLYKDVSRLPQE